MKIKISKSQWESMGRQAGWMPKESAGFMSGLWQGIKNVTNQPKTQTTPEQPKPQPIPVQQPKPQPIPVQQPKPQPIPIQKAKPQSTPIQKAKPQSTPAAQQKKEPQMTQKDFDEHDKLVQKFLKSQYRSGELEMSNDEVTRLKELEKKRYGVAPLASYTENWDRQKQLDFVREDPSWFSRQEKFPPSEQQKIINHSLKKIEYYDGRGSPDALKEADREREFLISILPYKSSEVPMPEGYVEDPKSGEIVFKGKRTPSMVNPKNPSLFLENPGLIL